MLVIVVPCGCFVFQNVLWGAFRLSKCAPNFFSYAPQCNNTCVLSCSSENYSRKIGGGLFILLRPPPPPPQRLDFRLDDGRTDGQIRNRVSISMIDEF